MNWNEVNEKKTAERSGARKREDSSTPIANSYSVCLKTLTKGHLESFTARTNKKPKKKTLWRMMARYENKNKKMNDCEREATKKHGGRSGETRRTILNILTTFPFNSRFFLGFLSRNPLLLWFSPRARWMNTGIICKQRPSLTRTPFLCSAKSGEKSYQLWLCNFVRVLRGNCTLARNKLRHQCTMKGRRSHGTGKRSNLIVMFMLNTRFAPARTAREIKETLGNANAIDEEEGKGRDDRRGSWTNQGHHREMQSDSALMGARVMMGIIYPSTAFLTTTCDNPRKLFQKSQFRALGANERKEVGRAMRKAINFFFWIIGAWMRGISFLCFSFAIGTIANSLQHTLGAAHQPQRWKRRMLGDKKKSSVPLRKKQLSQSDKFCDCFPFSPRRGFHGCFCFWERLSAVLKINCAEINQSFWEPA